ncbi:MAG: hypothetical protein WB987_03830 [Candidatus Acidiferrales bacterium]
MTNEIVDWVTARSKCSMGIIFEKLRKQVEEDVAIRQKIQQESANRYYAFKFSDTGKDSFSVLVEGNRIYGTVRFDWIDSAIHVSNRDGKQLLMATLTLNLEGECRIKINDQEYEMWQFRKMALESLFFNEPKP